MNFTERALTLVVIAGWVPIAVGVLGRLFVFRHDKHETAREGPRVRSHHTPKTHEEGFAIPSQEPKPGDSNYIRLDDEPWPPTTVTRSSSTASASADPRW